ncbi:MAG: Bug family tripartite tricarboxylate transporter substrate binding protein [Burkholderiales bacterium]
MRIHALAFMTMLAAGIADKIDAQTYPSKPIRVVSQFTPGGPGDVLTRAITQIVTQSLGQPFVIESRPGAEGLIAAEQCRTSTPDGYNLCAADSFTVSLLPVISNNMKFDPLKEMSPIVHFGFLSSLLLVHPTVAANTLEELFAQVKAKPGSITWGSWGPASSPHIYMEWLKKERGINFLEVPYKSAPFAWQGLQAGEIQVAIFASGPSRGVVNAGKAKALALVNPARSTFVPNIPTLREAGLPVDVLTWFALFAPNGTPRDMIQRINAEAVKGFFSNAALVEKFLTSQGYSTAAPTGGTPETFAAFLRQDRESNEKLAKLTGVRVDH